ncbi:MAG TPA: bifunctional 2-polyprenyl-6-hydroxyphenol methylase/3-demethylubiquinol 3-O-methyltransferase UbiG [Candidatus Eisenbacteria bacterium]|nr:bifunctional 2-polyprenyl-6-hydroxyphenol methylase/3-demethylubiquinol 3-O-methyltransferase UbiG [Candidatus Eisenbacteria bacterium]
MSHPSAHGPAGTKPGAPPGAPKDYRGLPDHEKYDRSSAENPEFWYDPAMGLQKLERLRFPYFQEHLGPFAGKRALDVGCGGGILAEDLARAGARVVGVDASQVTVEAARAHAARQGLDIEYRHGFGEDLAFTGEFDVAFAVDSLEHVNDLARTLDGIARALKTGGGFGFLTHNQTLEAFTEIIWKWEYQGDSAKGGHDFHKFITPADLTRALADRGLTVRHIQGIAWGDEPSLASQPTVSYMGYATK